MLHSSNSVHELVKSAELGPKSSPQVHTASGGPSQKDAISVSATSNVASRTSFGHIGLQV